MPATKRFLYRANRDAKRRRVTPMYYSKPESKYANKSITHSATNASTTNLCRIAAGTDTQERVGRKIRLKSAEVTLGLSGGAIRCILYVPKDQSDELVLSGYTGPVDNDKFWVLKDVLVQPQGAASGNTQTVKQMRHIFPFTMVTEYGGPLGDDINKNGVRLSLTTPGSTTVSGHTKIWFTDN